MNSPIARARSAQISLFLGHIYVFSDMLVNRLGTTPLRLVAAFDHSVAAHDLGAAIRSALAESLPWVEWEEFEARHDSLGDPISKAYGIPNRDLTKVGKQSGRVTVDDWPDKPDYSYTAWVKKGTSGKVMDRDYPIASKGCTDHFLGDLVLRFLSDSLNETLAANRPKLSK